MSPFPLFLFSLIPCESAEGGGKEGTTGGLTSGLSEGNTKSMRILKWFYSVSGLEKLVALIESFVLRYKLRIRMTPVSYKMFVLCIGVVIGGSAVYVHLEIPHFVQSLEEKSVAGVYVNHALAAEKPNIEVKELTIEEKIAAVFPENPTLMIAVFKAESGLDPMASHKNTNGTRDIGIAQINSVHGYDDLEMMDVDKNLAAAREIYDKQGIMAWYAFSNGSYKNYIK